MNGNNLPAVTGQAAPTSSVNDAPAPIDWRAHLPVHPAAEFFPLMSEKDPAALQELAESIKANGLLEPVVIWRDEADETFLLDGRNRLDAMALVGILGIDDHFLPCDVRTNRPTYSEQKVFDTKFAEDGKVDDPYAIVLGLNVHRRHLDAEQKRDLIAKVLAARPELSNRQIAEQVKDDHKKVGRVRSKLEATGALPQLKKTKGKDGKARPAKIGKKPIQTANGVEPEAKPLSAKSAEVSIEQRRAEHADLDLNPELEAEPEIAEDAEAEVKRLKTLKAKLKNNNEDKIDASASAKALAVFKAACDDRLPEMNADDLQSAIDYFAEAVEVPATELMPDLKDAQMDVKIAKAEVAALKHKLAGKLPPRESRANAWRRLADEAAANTEQLIEYQGEFESIRSAQPDSLQDGPLAQKCEEICGIDLESALSALQEAADAEVPLGFGRD